MPKYLTKQLNTGGSGANSTTPTSKIGINSAWWAGNIFSNLVSSGGTIDRKLDCSARFWPSSDQSNLPSIARSLPSDNESKHNQTAAILKGTFDRQDTL